MEINNKKNYLSHIRVSFGMLIFVICVTMNAFFCSTYMRHELNKTTVIEFGAISESILVNEDGNTNSYHETMTNIGSIFMIAAIPNGINLIFFLFIVFLFFFLNSFRFMPDRWTLINQKVRLDD